MATHVCTQSAVKPLPSLWPAFALGLAVAVGNGLGRFAYGLLLPVMRTQLEWAYAQAGWLTTANAVGYVLGAVSGYVLLYRVSARRLFVLGLWLSFLALAATGLDPSMPWLVSQRLLAGIGAAWVFTCGASLVLAHYQLAPSVAGIATGLFFAGTGVGIAASGIVVNPLLAWYGSAAWPYAWLALGLLGALAAIWPLRLLRSTHESATPAQRQARASFSPSAWGELGLSLLAYFCFAGGYIMYMTFILAWLSEKGWSWQLGTLLWTLLGAGVAIAPFLWRRALERWRGGSTLSASSVLALGGTLVSLVGDSASLMLSAAIFGVGAFIAPAAIAVLLRQQLAVNQQAKVMALFTAVFGVGQMIGPLLAGSIADHYGLGLSLWVGAGLLALAGLLPWLGRRL